MSQLDYQSTQNAKLNKRAVYYTLAKEINMTELDELLTDCCFLLQTSREGLGVTASAKGLLAGQMTRDMDIDYMQIPAKYSTSL